MGDRNPGLDFRGLLGRQEQRRKGAWGGDPREARANGCDEEEGPRRVGRAGQGGGGGVQLARCPGPKSRSRVREGVVGAIRLCRVEGSRCWMQQYRCCFCFKM